MAKTVKKQSKIAKKTKILKTFENGKKRSKMLKNS